MYNQNLKNFIFQCRGSGMIRFNRVALLMTLSIAMTSCTYTSQQERITNINPLTMSPNQLNELATLLYEQYSFLGTLILTFTPAPKELFREDIITVHEAIAKNIGKARSEKFFPYDCPDLGAEQEGIAKIYYSLKALRQEPSFLRIVKDIEKYQTIRALQPIATFTQIASYFSLANLLLVDGKMTAVCNKLSKPLVELIKNYNKDFRDFHNYYIRVMATLRAKTPAQQRSNVTFHRYLTFPKKILPPTLLPIIVLGRIKHVSKQQVKEKLAQVQLEDIDLVMKRFESKKPLKKQPTPKKEKAPIKTSSLQKKYTAKTSRRSTTIKPLIPISTQSRQTSDALFEAIRLAFIFQDTWIAKLTEHYHNQEYYTKLLVQLRNQYLENRALLEPLLQINDATQEHEDFRDLKYIRAILMSIMPDDTDLANPEVILLVQHMCMHAMQDRIADVSATEKFTRHI